MNNIKSDNYVWSLKLIKEKVDGVHLNIQFDSILLKSVFDIINH